MSILTQMLVPVLAASGCDPQQGTLPGRSPQFDLATLPIFSTNSQLPA
jgi:hypothetical protein